MRVIYHSEAELELIEAGQFYEQRLPGLGGQFLDSADQSIRVIIDAPDRWRNVEAGVRQYKMRGFPYFIYYFVLVEEVRILAVKHHSRHPDYWRHRISE